MNPTFDQTIERIEQLYSVLTGTRPPTSDGTRAPIPPEVDPIVHVHEQLDRMVEAFESVLPQEPAWTPRASIVVEGEYTSISIDVPGIRREQLQIRVGPDELVVSGRRARPRGTLACDTPFGRFTRSFSLATRISPDRIAARLVDGVLTVRVHAIARTHSSEVSITS